MGQSDQNQKQKHSGLPAGLSVKSKSKIQSESRAAFLWERACSRKPESAAFIQNAHVIVNDLREQARSHIWTVPALAFDFALQHSSRPGGRCALAFDLLLILILGAPLNHAGRTQALERG
jgi:hypothetical protein